MVRPEMATVLPGPTWNTRLVAFPSTARLSAPGPEMVMFLSTSSSPLVKPILPDTAKVMVSPSLASASAWRNEPGPLSLVFVTVIVAACARNATAQNRAAAIPANLILGVILVFIGVSFTYSFGKFCPALQENARTVGSVQSSCRACALKETVTQNAAKTLATPQPRWWPRSEHQTQG